MKRVVKILNDIIDIKIRIQRQSGAHDKDFNHLAIFNKELEMALNEAIHTHGGFTQV